MHFKGASTMFEKKIFFFSIHTRHLLWWLSVVNFGSRIISGKILVNFQDILYLTNEYTPISTRNRFLDARFEQPQSTFCQWAYAMDSNPPDRVSCTIGAQNWVKVAKIQTNIGPPGRNTCQIDNHICVATLANCIINKLIVSYINYLLH